jgi:hypothetical protein
LRLVEQQAESLATVVIAADVGVQDVHEAGHLGKGLAARLADAREALRRSRAVTGTSCPAGPRLHHDHREMVSDDVV